jgi:hypothetical protein
MDQQKLRNLVFEKTGVKVDSNDPIFALVALNEAVLAETVESHLALLDDATARLLEHAGVRDRNASAEASSSPAPGDSAASHAGPQFSTHDKRVLALAGAVGLGAALLVLAAQALFFRPAPTPPTPTPMPAPVTAPAKPDAPALSAEQSAALARADKLSKAVQKLDPKSRAMIAAEMKKP